MSWEPVPSARAIEMALGLLLSAFARTESSAVQLACAVEPSPLGARLAVDVAVILLTTLGALALAAVTLRRRTD
jgi:hypothetical protein